MHTTLAHVPHTTAEATTLETAAPAGAQEPGAGTTWFDAGMLVAEAAAAVRCGGDGPRVIVDVSVPDLPVMVAGDGRKLRQVLMNLADAAARCAESGMVFLGLAVHGSTLEFRIIGTETLNDRTAVCRASFRRPDTFAGPGALALAGEEHSVQLLGGSLVAALGAGGGCTFLLTLPLGSQDRRGWMYSPE